MRWYIEIAGETFGPFNPVDIIQMVRDGRIPAGTLLRDGPEGTLTALEDAAFYRRSTGPVLTQSVAHHTQRKIG